MPQRFFAILLLGLLWMTPALAQEAAGVSEADRLAIRQVIDSQLAAFQRDDGGQAFSFAAPGIQRKFGTPEIFMQMVKSGYPAVYRPREVEFRDIRLRGETVQQEVLFVGPDGQPVIALYSMQQQADGSWRISGVIILRAPEATT